MGILRGFRDTKLVMRAPRIQLHSDVQNRQAGLQLSNTSMHMTPTPMPRPVRTGGGDAPADEALTPIEGVSLERYATIVRGIAAYNYDQSMLSGIAADNGIAFDTWRQVHEGWNQRIKADTAVARRFSDIYHGAS